MSSTIYLLIGSLSWLLLEQIFGTSRSIYGAAIRKNQHRVWIVQVAFVFTVAFLITAWPLVYGVVLVNTARALWRGDPA